MNEIIFLHGLLVPGYEKQANKQGYTLGKKAKDADTLRNEINSLYLWDVLTESQRQKAYRRLLEKVIIPNLKKIKGDAE